MSQSSDKSSKKEKSSKSSCHRTRSKTNIPSPDTKEKKDTKPNPVDSALDPDLNPEEDVEQKVSMSEILDDEEKLLFSLRIIGSIQKNEKLMKKDAVLTIDDRWVQPLRRWWTEDNRETNCDEIYKIISASCEQVNLRLDEDYAASLVENAGTYDDEEETMESKKRREGLEKCRQRIQDFFLSLSNAKTGIDNTRATYTDKFSQAKLDLTLDKLNNIVEKLKSFKHGT